ncbi:hypothetical protein AGMMS49992_19090 [Clostridia bacterium]|nr:hypothetical protein AGMMS49992_19090 [Clostridia bacterium]
MKLSIMEYFGRKDVSFNDVGAYSTEISRYPVYAIQISARGFHRIVPPRHTYLLHRHRYEHRS